MHSVIAMSRLAAYGENRMMAERWGQLSVFTQRKFTVMHCGSPVCQQLLKTPLVSSVQ